MNTNDLPIGARLAAFIIAGRAMYPEFRHHNDPMLCAADRKSGCALAIAGLGAGMTKQDLLDERGCGRYEALGHALGVPVKVGTGSVPDRISNLSDHGASLDKIIEELTVGALAKQPA